MALGSCQSWQGVTPDAQAVNDEEHVWFSREAETASWLMKLQPLWASGASPQSQSAACTSKASEARWLVLCRGWAFEGGLSLLDQRVDVS